MKKFFLICAAVIFLSGASCSAENLKFIDAMDDTGYYYDADSIQIENSSVLRVDMAVIKASLNRMYVYDVQINHSKKTYEILSSKILSYDTRAEIESNKSRRPVQTYSKKSELGQMVQLILYGE